MKYKLPILTIALLAVLVVWHTFQHSTRRQLLAQPASGNSTATSRAKASSLPQGTDGNQLLLQAADTVASQRALRASIRHRVTMFGHHLAGTGDYLQLNDRSGRPLRFRWEVKLPQGEELVTIQQVCDGRFLWFRRANANDSSLSRVNLIKLQEKRRAGQGTSPPFSTSLIGADGVPGLLRRLAENFDFSSPRTDKLRNVPVWRVHGEWKPARLKRLVPDKSGDFSKLPVHLPHRVVVVLARKNKIPLFPYLVEFRREEEGKRVPLVTVELFQVAAVPDLTPSAFELDPGEQIVFDETEEWLSRSAVTK